MGGIFDSSQTTNSVKKTQVPGNVQQVYDQVLSMGQQAANQPFQPYDLQRIADFSPEEQQALNRLSSQQGMYDPLLQAAALSQMDMVGQGGVPTQSDLDQFMNPYTHNVVDYAVNGLSSQYQTQMRDLGAKSGMMGAFGGTRQGVEEANLGSAFQQNAGSLYYGGMKDNFDQAMSNWFNSQNLRQSENINASNLAIGGANYNINNANALSNLGGIKRGVNQANLDFAYQQFEQNQAYPWQQTGNLANVAYNYPRDIFTQTNNSTTTTQPSLGSIIMGGAMMAAGAASGNPGAISAGANTMKSAYDVGNTSAIPFAQASYQSAYNPSIQSPYTTQATPGKKAGGLVKGYKKGGKVKKYSDGGGISSGSFGNSGNGLMGGSLIPGIFGGVIPGLGSLKGTPSGPKQMQQQRKPATFDANAAGWNNNMQDWLANKYHMQNPYGGYQQPTTDSTPPWNLPPDTSGMPGDFRNPQSMLRNQLVNNFARSNSVGNGLISQRQFADGGYVNHPGARESTNVEDHRGSVYLSDAALDAQSIPEKYTLNDFQRLTGMALGYPEDPQWKNRSYRDDMHSSSSFGKRDVEAAKYRSLMDRTAKGGWDLGDLAADIRWSKAAALKYPSKLDVAPEDDIFPDTAVPYPAKYAKGGKIKKFAKGRKVQQDTGYTSRDVVNGLVARGFSPEEAAVAAGNIFGESGFNTKAIGDNGKSLGLMQWKGPRRKALEQLASDRGVDPTDFNVQLDHAASELRGPEQKNFLRAMREGKSLEDKTGLFMKYVERPSDTSEGNRTRRVNAAQDAFNQYHAVQGATPSGRAQPPLFSGRERVGNNALSGSILDYASDIPVRDPRRAYPLPSDAPDHSGLNRYTGLPFRNPLGQLADGEQWVFDNVFDPVANGASNALTALSRRMYPTLASNKDTQDFVEAAPDTVRFLNNKRQVDSRIAANAKSNAQIRDSLPPATNDIFGPPREMFGNRGRGGYNRGKDLTTPSMVNPRVVPHQDYLNSLLLNGAQQQPQTRAVDMEQDRSGPPMEIPNLPMDLQPQIPSDLAHSLGMNQGVMPRRKPMQPAADPIASLIRSSQNDPSTGDDEARRIARYLQAHPEMIGQHIPEGSYKKGGYVKKFKGGGHLADYLSGELPPTDVITPDGSMTPSQFQSMFVDPLPQTGNATRGEDWMNTFANYGTLPLRALTALGMAGVDIPRGAASYFGSPATPGGVSFGPAEHGAPQSDPSANPLGFLGREGLGSNDPGLPQAQDPEDDLNNSIRELLNRNVKDMLDNKQEGTGGPFLGLFPNANEPLMKFGLNLLANSDMNFGTALGRAGLATAQDQSQTRMENMKERDQQIKDLVQTQYMRNMTRGMDPKDRAGLAMLQGQMKIQQQENAAKIKERLMRLAIQLDPSKQFMLKLLEDQTNQDEDVSQ